MRVRVPEERIFLEMKPAIDGDLGGHMYLVKRRVDVEDGVVLSNDYQSGVNQDQVIRGAFGSLLGAYEQPLGQSLDQYGPDETPQTRHSVDITDLVGGISCWSDFEVWADAINNKYSYEPPYLYDHTANSNAVVLSLLANAGVDIRDLSVREFVLRFGAPGANSGTATLLAVGDITSAAALDHDVASSAETVCPTPSLTPL